MDTDRSAPRRSWQVNLLFTGGVMITVLLALILAQLDALQARAALDRPSLSIVNIQATAIAVGNIIPLEFEAKLPDAAAELAAPVPDDLNPRPGFITGVSDEGVIYTVCGAVPEGWLLYTVQPGETLASLAAGTEITAAELVAANCLAGELSVGMQLLVPRQPAVSLCGPPQWWVRYQVQRGDTIGSLAVLRGTTVDEVLRANCRDSSDLQAGQFIFLPPGAQPGSVAPIPQPSLTPLPTPTVAPTLAPPTATTPPDQPPPPSPTAPIVASPVPPTATPPPLPTTGPPTVPPPAPTEPPPTQPPPTEPPPTEPPPTEPPPTQPPPTQPPPTEPPPTEPPPPTEQPAPIGEGG